VVAGADADAKHSREIVGKAVEAMGAITESSSRIGQIIVAIDEIAFQTNLLALNAGVEAARAGDSGKGFAVVASEVRALAQRSAQAAKEIKELISASMAQVEAGAELVTGAGAALERIAGKVSEINGVVAEIADTAKDQLAGVSDIHQALTEMDAATQENAAMAREATASSRELAAESDDLGELMRQFKVGAPAATAVDKVVALPRTRRSDASRPAPPPKSPRLKTANADWSEF